MAVIEVAAFQLTDGADEAAFLDADRAVQTEFIPNKQGFIRRTTARGERGNWGVITMWWSAEDAEAAQRAGETDEHWQRFMALVDPSSWRAQRFTTLD